MVPKDDVPHESPMILSDIGLRPNIRGNKIRVFIIDQVLLLKMNWSNFLSGLL